MDSNTILMSVQDKLPQNLVEQQQTYLDLLSLGAIALNLHANGLAYDNSNGDLMIESDFAK